VRRLRRRAGVPGVDDVVDPHDLAEELVDDAERCLVRVVARLSVTAFPPSPVSPARSAKRSTTLWS